MAMIRTHQGDAILVDDVDLPRIQGMRWGSFEFGRGLKYAYAYCHGSRTYLHRLLVACPAGLVVDHINHDGLDNRRVNLRIVEHHENLHNAGKYRTQQPTSSRYRGVSRDSRAGKWRARIWVKDVDYSLGMFGSEEDALRAYDEAKNALLSAGGH